MNFKISAGFYEIYIFGVLAAALFISVLYSYSASFNKTAHTKKLVILLKSIRFTAFLAVAFLCFTPSVTYEKTENEKSPFLIIFDTSLSMNFNNDGKKNSRFNNAINALADSGVIDNLKHRHDIEFFAFSNEIKNVNNFEELYAEPRSSNTDISAAISALIQKNEAKGALLVSDGRSTSDTDPQLLARYVKFPIFTLGIGAETNIKDISITHADYPRSAYLKEQAEVIVNIANSGFTGHKSTLALKQGDEIIERIPISFDNAAQKIKFNFKPSKTGLVKYELSIPSLEGEITDENNRFAFFINVTEHKIRILAAAQTPDTDFSYLLKFLASNEDIEFKFKFLKTPIEKMLLKPSDLDGGYDIIIFSGVNFTTPGAEIAAKLENTAASGMNSMLFIGGPDFNIKTSSPCASRFPFNLESSDGFIYEPINYKPFPAANTSAEKLVRLSPVARINDYMWNDIPGLCGINLLKNNGAFKNTKFIAQGDVVLYSDVKSEAANSIIRVPILTVKNSQGRKSAALLGGSFWFLKAGQLFSKNSNFYDRFMGNLILWLYSKEDGAAFKVETDRANYYDSDRIFVSISARNRDFSPMINPIFKISLKTAEGIETIEPPVNMSETGFYEFSLKPEKSGEHEIIVEADDSGGKKEKNAARFIILNSSKEMLDCTADYKCLKKISEASGGKFYDIKNISSITADAPARSAVKKINVTINTFESGAAFALILILLCAEWTIRRYSGLE